MRQRCWLWWFCLTACMFCGRVANGQVLYHEGERDLRDLTTFGKLSNLQLSSLHDGKTNIPLLSFVPADTFHRDRFWVATGVTAALYGGTVIALNEAWYKQYPRTSFHFFDDAREWQYMDKMGHLYTTYFESLWSYKIARWTGMKEKASLWTGVGLGLLFQGTVEVLDGFSEEWGFSLADAGFNLLGSGVFVAQQELWNEQRIVFKVSSTPISYPETIIASTNGEEMVSLQTRAEDLFGNGYAERFLKDYNAQTTWLSVNIYAFLKPENRFPKWLNVAIGYGAENMYGGFRNSWKDDEGKEYIVPATDYPRYHQFYLSPDIDFTRIPIRSAFLRTVLGVLNVFKMPGPVLEMSGEKGVKLKLRW